MTDMPEKSSDSSEHDALYLRGIELFNAGEYYDSHDVWEELWTDYRGPDRHFYQGLIQTAVALYHLSRGNLHGARRMYYSSRSYLAPYPAEHLGMNLVRLLSDMELCFRPCLDLPEGSKLEPVDPETIPRIHASEAT